MIFSSVIKFRDFNLFSLFLSGRIIGELTNGNANVDPVTQFMGTTDNRDFVFKTNNVERMRIKSSGVVQVSGGLKIDSISTDSLRAVYVDQGGVLRIVRSGTGSNCVGPINGWLANYCNLYPGNIYLQPGLNNVGIGTTTPTAKLDVVGDIQSSNLSSSAFSLLQSTSSGKIVKVLSATNPSTEVLYGNGSWAPLPIGASVWNYVGGYIYSNPLNAKVGINTSTPSEQLEVAGVIMTSATQNQGNSIKLWHDNLNGIISSFGAGNLLINYNNGKNVDICTGASSGSVSIGGNTYLALNNASVGIGTTLTNEILQIGDRFVFHNGGNKILGYNFASSAGAHRIKDDYSSALFFGPSGDIHLKVADNDVAGSSITWKESLNINSDSHLGFNTAPSSSAHVNARSSGMFLIDGVQSSLLIGNDNASTPYGEFGIEYMEDGPIAQQGLNFWKPYQATGMDGNYLMYITNYGNVGINVQDPSKLTDDEYKLSVNGGIRANKIKVYLYPWADYVFNPDYKLMPLKDLESFILKNKHLPGVESADEVETNGLDLGKNQAKLLEKIEELTLYVIIIKKENEKLNQVVMEMQSKMNK